MSELGWVRRMMAHDAWANGATLAALRPGPAADKACRWMAHIIGAERTWLARLREEPPTMPVWPELALDACVTELAALTAEWEQWLGALDDDGLDEGVGYRNSKGEFWTSTVREILTHVVLHASYHRGQIAAAIREAGGAPPYTDYIHAVRAGIVE